MSAGSRISLSDNISDSKLPLASPKRSRTPTSQYPLQSDTFDCHQDHKRRVIKDDSQSLRTFACPFYKFDPVRYSETDVSCSSVHLASISRVKQHLYGVHWAPYMSNARCPGNSIRYASAVGQTAAGTPKRPSHGSKRVHDASKDLTDDQYLEIKVKRPREDKEDAWYRLYTMALPGAELPAYPYVDPSNKTSPFFQRFRAQGPETFSRRIREQFSARVEHSGQLLPQEEQTKFQEEVLEAAVSTVLEEFLRTSVQHEGGQSTIFTDPSPESRISLPSYTDMGDADNIKGQPQLTLRPPSSGEEECGDVPIPRASSSFLGPLEPSPRFGWSPHEEPFPEDTSPARSGVTASGYTHGDTNGYVKIQHGIGPAGDSEQQIPRTSSYDTTFTADCLGETAQSAWEGLDQMPGLPKYEDVWPGLTISDKSAWKTPGNSDVAPSGSQTLSFASQGTTKILDQREDLVSERERKRASTKSSGKASQRMSCLSIKGPNKDKCPSSCLIYSSFDIYSIQRHEKMVHGDLYSKHQEVLLASLGKKKDAESRWLALFEVVSGEDHHGSIDPYYHPPDLDDTITAASKTSPFKLANTITPASLARLQTYKVLQDMVVERFDVSKTEIERYRHDTELEITSHVHRVLHAHAERFRNERALAKCEAISALRLDFDAGRDIKPEEVIARYASQVSWNPFEVREVLVDVGAAYPDVGFLDVVVDATNSSRGDARD